MSEMPLFDACQPVASWTAAAAGLRRRQEETALLGRRPTLGAFVGGQDGFGSSRDVSARPSSHRSVLRAQTPAVSPPSQVGQRGGSTRLERLAVGIAQKKLVFC